MMLVFLLSFFKNIKSHKPKPSDSLQTDDVVVVTPSDNVVVPDLNKEFKIFKDRHPKEDHATDAPENLTEIPVDTTPSIKTQGTTVWYMLNESPKSNIDVTETISSKPDPQNGTTVADLEPRDTTKKPPETLTESSTLKPRPPAHPRQSLCRYILPFLCQLVLLFIILVACFGIFLIVDYVCDLKVFIL